MNQIVPTASSSIGLWVWLFPLAYGLHIAEEYWLHFPDWISDLSRSFVSNTQFLVLNSVFWLLMFVSVVAIRARTSLAWLVATLAAILGINAALHLVGSLVTAPIHQARSPPHSSTFLWCSTHFGRCFRGLPVVLHCGP